MFDLQKAIYFSSPLWVKKLYACIPYPVRMGRPYRHVVRMLSGSESWDDQQARSYQAEQLRAMLRGAFEKVPFYREWARRENASADDFRDPDDIRALPLVSKEIIQENVGAFTREDRWRFPHSQDSTSGSTGKPFQFPADDSAYRKEQAFLHYLCARVGYRPIAPRLTLCGRAVINPKTNNCWVHNPFQNELNLSVYNMTECMLPRYVAACAEFRPEFLLGYPSAITAFAEFLLNYPDEKSKFPQLTAVFGASEALLPGQREIIERAFGCRLFTWYGMTERVILAGECEESTLYHCLPQYGITELVDEQGQSITEPGIEGELVGTGFINEVMPFIRYKMGDYSCWSEGYCKRCRRAHPLLDGVRGRAQDQVIGSDGRRVTMTALAGAIHGPEFLNVDRLQFYKDTCGLVVLRLKVRQGFGDSDEQRIQHTLKEKLGDAFQLEIKLVSSIPLSSRGKHSYLIQEITPADRAGRTR